MLCSSLMPSKEVFVCIPGLGGHESALADFEKKLPEFQFKFLRIVDPDEAERELEAMCRSAGKVTLFCNCYGSHLAIRVIQKMPHTVERLIIVEPMFVALHRWLRLLIPLNRLALALVRFSTSLGVYRRHRWETIDYRNFEWVPIWCQSILDILWQPLDKYLLKTLDMLQFELPESIEKPTLFVLSPKGLLRSERNKKFLGTIFVNLQIVTVTSNTHNIISHAEDEIVASIRTWFSRVKRTT